MKCWQGIGTAALVGVWAGMCGVLIWRNAEVFTPDAENDCFGGVAESNGSCNDCGDTNRILREGTCQCPQGMKSDTAGRNCQCSENGTGLNASLTECLVCTEHQMNLHEGKCQCPNSSSLDKSGSCVCQDPEQIVTLVGSEFVCKTKKSNVCRGLYKGTCVECDAPNDGNCTACEDGQEAELLDGKFICKATTGIVNLDCQGLIKAENGQCICPEGKNIWAQKSCEVCAEKQQIVDPMGTTITVAINGEAVSGVQCRCPGRQIEQQNGTCQLASCNDGEAPSESDCACDSGRKLFDGLCVKCQRDDLEVDGADQCSCKSGRGSIGSNNIPVCQPRCQAPFIGYTDTGCSCPNNQALMNGINGPFCDQCNRDGQNLSAAERVSPVLFKNITYSGKDCNCIQDYEQMPDGTCTAVGVPTTSNNTATTAIIITVVVACCIVALIVVMVSSRKNTVMLEINSSVSTNDAKVGVENNHIAIVAEESQY